MMHSVTSSDAPSFEAYAGDAWPSLYRFAYLLAGNHADAEDLAQQTLLKAYGSWSRVVRSRSPEAYVRRILSNTFLSGRRPKKRRLEVLTDSPPERQPVPAPRGPEDHLLLWPHVKALPPRQRAVIVLRYYEDLSERETAETLGCPIGTVKSSAHSAIKTLHAALAADATGGKEH